MNETLPDTPQKEQKPETVGDTIGNVKVKP